VFTSLNCPSFRPNSGYLTENWIKYRNKYSLQNNSPRHSATSLKRQTWPAEKMAQRTQEVHSLSSKTNQIQLRNCSKWPQPWQVF